MSKSFKITTIITLFLLFAFFPFLVSAKLVPCGQADAPECRLCHIFILVRNIVTLASEIIIPLAVLFIVVGGIAILTSAGSTERASTGKRMISYAVKGFVVTFAAWIIINSIIVVLVNPDIFPLPWNAWKLKCPIVKIDPSITTATSYTILRDADNSGDASPGDSLRYSLTYTNTSSENFSDLVITSDYDQNHIFSITNISEGGTDDSDKITWQIGNLKSNQSVTISYDFILATNFSDLLGKRDNQESDLFSKILNKISKFLNQKVFAQTQTIYLQNIIAITSNQAETESINDPVIVIVAAQNIGDPEDIPGNPIYLAGYYEEPDDSSSKWPSYDWYFNQVANNGGNAIRMLFYNPNNPFYSVSPWINNDCSQPKDSFYTDWLVPTINKANSRGIYAILTLYSGDDWTCNNKTQENREKTYDRIIDFLRLPQDKVIIETNWEPDIHGDDWLREQAKYFKDRGISTIITDEDYDTNGGATNSVSTYAGRHRQWDRDTSLRYFDRKPTIWTERFFTLYNSPNPMEPMTRFEARQHIYRDALTVRQPILFYYLRWSTPGEPDLPSEYLKDVGYVVELAKKIPWKEMVPREKYGKTVGDKGFWAIKDNEAALGWVNNESQIKIDITGWSGKYDYWWYNPRNGKFNYIDTISETPISQTFTVSTPDSSEDWVFVLKGEKITPPPPPPPPSHKECVNNSCVVVEGAGVNQCSVNADCGVPPPPDKYVFVRARYPDQCTQQPCQYGLSITSLRSEGCITAVCLHTRECWWNWHAEEYANYTVSPNNSKDWEVVENVCNSLGLPVPAGSFVCNRGAVASRYDSLIPENETHGINNYGCTNVPVGDVCPTGKAPWDVWGVCKSAHSLAAGASHKECVNNSCVVVEDVGANQCGIDADCAAPTLSATLSANPSSGNAPLNGVVLTADVSGTATGTINYTFYCNRSDAGTDITSGYVHKLDATNSDPYSAPVGVCDSVYANPGTYTAKVIAERRGLAVESRTTVKVTAITPPTLSVTLSANPSSGNAPLNGVVFTADVSGTVTGTINYTFYCNRSDAGTDITPGWTHKLDATNSDPYSAPAGVCDSVYAAPGTYTAKVIVERGGFAVEDRVTITVSTAPTGVDYWLWGVRPCDSTIPCQTYCDNDGADYCVRGMASCEYSDLCDKEISGENWNGCGVVIEDGVKYCLCNLQILQEGETGCSTGRTGDYECSFREAGACIDVSCRCGNYH